MQQVSNDPVLGAPLAEPEEFTRPTGVSPELFADLRSRYRHWTVKDNITGTRVGFVAGFNLTDPERAMWQKVLDGGLVLEDGIWFGCLDSDERVTLHGTPEDAIEAVLRCAGIWGEVDS